MPPPGHQIVLGDMLLQHCQIASAIAGGIFQLATDVTDSLAFPSHREWCETPAWMAWNALISGGPVQRDIVVGVTLFAMCAEMPSVAAPDSRHMLVMVGALERVCARGMTICAPRMRQRLSDLARS